MNFRNLCNSKTKLSPHQNSRALKAHALVRDLENTRLSLAQALLYFSHRLFPAHFENLPLISHSPFFSPRFFISFARVRQVNFTADNGFYFPKVYTYTQKSTNAHLINLRFGGIVVDGRRRRRGVFFVARAM